MLDGPRIKGSVIFYHQRGSWNLRGTHEFWKLKGGNRRIFAILMGKQKNFTDPIEKNLKGRNIFYIRKM